MIIKITPVVVAFVRTVVLVNALEAGKREHFFCEQKPPVRRHAAPAPETQGCALVGAIMSGFGRYDYDGFSNDVGDNLLSDLVGTGDTFVLIYIIRWV
jgi:hypothetical protein